MRLYAPILAFVDLETTGMSAAADAITEVAVVRVTADPSGGAPTVDEWSTLVHPGRPIPFMIQGLTGITDAMVRNAPPFAAIADEVARRTADAILVAHNARFDYGFLRHAFARAGRSFSARVLCSVKLSRRLFPDAASHSLDSVIARHGLVTTDRHRALGDARALWSFTTALYATLQAKAIEDAANGILKTPSLPPQLPHDAIDALPELPGVYRFHGIDDRLLYIGRGSNLRDRIGAHFLSGKRSATDRRLSLEIRRIEFEVTAGEFGALLRASMLVKALRPAFNPAARQKADAVSVDRGPIPAWPYPGPVAVREHNALSGRTELHVIRDWRWLGTVSDDNALAQLLEGLSMPEFDPEVARLLLRTLARAKHPVIALPFPSPVDRQR